VARDGKNSHAIGHNDVRTLTKYPEPRFLKSRHCPEMIDSSDLRHTLHPSTNEQGSGGLTSKGSHFISSYADFDHAASFAPGQLLRRFNIFADRDADVGQCFLLG
jgi:hypothetical protein